MLSYLVHPLEEHHILLSFHLEQRDLSLRLHFAHTVPFGPEGAHVLALRTLLALGMGLLVLPPGPLL